MAMIDVEMLKAAGLSEEIIQNALRQHRVAEADNEIKSISESAEMAAIKGLLESAENPYRCILARNGDDVTFKLSLWEGKASTAGKAKGQRVKVAGVEYDTAADACREHDWDFAGNSAVRVLTRECKKAEIDLVFLTSDAEPKDDADK